MATKSVATGVSVLRKRAINVERSGKLASVGEWGGLGLYLLGRVAGKYGHENADDELRKYGRVVMDAGIGLAFASAGELLVQLFEAGSSRIVLRTLLINYYI